MELESFKNRIPCHVRIRQALDEKNMSQAELARITGLSKSAISQYISGKFEPKQDAIYLISKALDVSEVWLMGLDLPKERVEKIKTAVTPEEKNLLDLYAKLPKEKQTEILNMIDYWLHKK